MLTRLVDICSYRYSKNTQRLPLFGQPRVTKGLEVGQHGIPALPWLPRNHTATSFVR